MYFSGRVHTVIFDNPANDFYVLRMVLDEEEKAEGGNVFGFDDEPASAFSSKQVVARGNVPGMTVSEGSWFGFEGKWVNHPQHGRQISINRAPVIREWTAQVAISMLIAEGCGERTLRAAYKALDAQFVPALDNGDEPLLCKGKGVTPAIASHMVSNWRRIKAYHRTLGFLNRAGIPTKISGKIWSTFGDDAEEVLTENPWALVQIRGITFSQADEVARKLGLSMDHPNRIRGAVLHASKASLGMGHLYIGSGDIVAEVKALIGDVDPKSIAKHLGGLHKEKLLKIDRKTRPGLTAIYQPWLHEVEKQSAEMLYHRVQDATLDDEDLIRQYAQALGTIGKKAEAVWKDSPQDIRSIARASLEDLAVTSHITLSPDQLEGALNALTEPVSVLTGLPGTGKTTTLRMVVQALTNAEVSFLLIAPTGIASKRMNEMTGAPAYTIHRAFKAKGFKGDDEERKATYHGVVGESEGLSDKDGSLEEWGAEGEVHPADVIICDESSMVDQHLLYRILECTKPSARLVFVGDDAQLPSVGPGNVLREMIRSNLFPTVNLTTIFRQDNLSDIVVAAHDIFKGMVPEVRSDTSSDFMLLPKVSEDEILSIIMKLAAKLYGDRKQFQVISPRHKGTLGVTNLNARLREVINPKQSGLGEMRIGSETLREGDRVMVIRNDYKLEVFNGDVGKVVKLHRLDKKIEVKIHGAEPLLVKIPFEKAGSMLRLAYCQTVHKCQGQEYEHIIFPVVRQFRHQLQRNLLYTAITRAKKKVILVGHRDALVTAVQNTKVGERNTLFFDRLDAAFNSHMEES